jgi:hypothetical protein
MSATRQAQVGLEDRIVEDADLEAALESWFELKAKKAEAEAAAKKQRENVDALLGKYALEPGEEIRVGPYKIAVRFVEEADVAFTRSAKEQTDIRDTTA